MVQSDPVTTDSDMGCPLNSTKSDTKEIRQHMTIVKLNISNLQKVIIPRTVSGLWPWKHSNAPINVKPQGGGGGGGGGAGRPRGI